MHTVNNSTVLRIRVQSGAGQPPKVLGQQVIANGIPWRDDPAALVIGPTGRRARPRRDAVSRRHALEPDRGDPAGDDAHHSRRGWRYDRVGGGKLIQPLGLTLAPNGDILTTNAGDGNIVETTPAGKQLIAQTADKKTGAGSLFGLVIDPAGNGVFYVDDGDNTLKLLH